jgi:hypothetical protein
MFLICQVPFEAAVSSVLEQLKKVAKGEHRTPDTEKRRFGNIIFAAVTLPAGEIIDLLEKVIILSISSSFLY